jgi:hypothetical protein
VGAGASQCVDSQPLAGWGRFASLEQAIQERDSRNQIGKMRKILRMFRMQTARKR